jgi:hypothetical protein
MTFGNGFKLNKPSSTKKRIRKVISKAFPLDFFNSRKKKLNPIFFNITKK